MVRDDVKKLLDAAHEATVLGRARRQIDKTGPMVLSLSDDADLAITEYVFAVADALEAAVYRLAEAIDAGSK